jgi:hypothetical protein
VSVIRLARPSFRVVLGTTQLVPLSAGAKVFNLKKDSLRQDFDVYYPVPLIQLPEALSKTGWLQVYNNMHCFSH